MTGAPRLRVLDLFSCIGGHGLGLTRAGLDVVQFCESDPWRRAVIAHHFPGVPVHDDVRTLDPQPGSADVVAGGPPCQATSRAAAMWGKRTGNSLWPEMHRIVERVGPAWVVVEQPPGAKGWEGIVSRDLGRTGYVASWVDLSAFDAGAPHTRRRRFAIANRDVSRLAVGVEAIERAKGRAINGHPWVSPYGGILRVDAGVSRRVERHRRRRIMALGDSNPPAMMQVIGAAIVAASAAD